MPAHKIIVNINKMDSIQHGSSQRVSHINNTVFNAINISNDENNEIKLERTKAETSIGTIFFPEFTLNHHRLCFHVVQFMFIEKHKQIDF